jgi:hypothetical protein
VQLTPCDQSSTEHDASIASNPSNCIAVVVALVGGLALTRCVESLRNVGLSAIVVGPQRLLATELGDSLVVYSDEPVPRRRALGVGASLSEWIVLIEDTCVLTDSWSHTLQELAATAGSLHAIGGPVAIANALPPLGIALGCVEYGEFAPHRIADRTPCNRLHGLCIIYRRAAIAGSDLLIDTETQNSILASGGQMEFRSSLCVSFAAFDPATATASARFTHGRIYGGGQRMRLSVMGRWLASLKCLALPPVLTLRALAGVPPHASQKLAVYLHILRLNTGWACGELIGLLRGRGAALQEWQ